MTGAADPIAGRVMARARLAPQETAVAGLPTPAVVRWLFAAFAATLPFEAMDLGFASSSLSLAKISGLMWMAAYFFYHNALTRKRKAPRVATPLVLFGLYLVIYALNGFFIDGRDLRQFIAIMMTLLQLLLVFWIASDLLRQPKLARTVLMAFALAAVISALGSLLALPGFSSAIHSRAGERMTALDFNPNYLAYIMALAALILIECSMSLRKPWQRYLVMASVLPLLAMMVRTGSRGGLAAFVIGFLTYVLFNRQPRQRWTVAALSLLVAASLFYSVSRHSTVLTRFEESYRGNLAGRQNIIPASLDMFLERPLTGWGPVTLWSELSRRTGQIWSTRDAHNLYLHLLLEVGIVGAAPFLIALYLCARAAWRARAASFGFLPLALMATVLSANLAHTYLTRKPQWLLLALAVAAGSAARSKQPGQSTKPVYDSRFKVRGAKFNEARPLAGAHPPQNEPVRP